MDIEDALKWADVWSKVEPENITGKDVAIAVLAAEVRRLRRAEMAAWNAEIRKANPHW